MCIIFILFLILYIIFLTTTINNYRINKVNKDNIKILIRQIARWATAALQDENPMIAVLHANYSAGYLYALTDIKTDSEIYDATGIDIKKLRNEVINVQDITTTKMLNRCPIDVKNKFLARIAKEI